MRLLPLLFVLIAVASLGRPAPRAVTPAAAPAAGHPHAARLLWHEPLDVNVATAADLEALPGVGEARAAAIARARADRGGRFERLDDLLEVPGIGEGTFARIAPLLAVDPR